VSLSSNPINAATSTDEQEWLRPGVAAAICAGAAALPSLAWAAFGPALLIDDWGYAAKVHFGGGWHLLRLTAVVQPGRPAAAVYWALTFTVFGTHPVGHALALAALNAAAGVLLFFAARRLWGPRLALWIGIAWAVLPNRSSSQMWFSTAQTILAVALFAAGVLFLCRRQHIAASLALAASVLSYESVLGLVTLAFVVWAVARRPGWRRVLAVVTPAAAAAAYIALATPKDASRLHFGPHAGGLLAAHFGRGLWGPASVAVVAGGLSLLALAVLAYAQMKHTLPRQGQVVLVGAVLLLAGAGPLLVLGTGFATTGILDRFNVTADVGTAVMVGAAAAWAWDRRGLLGAAAITAALGWMGVVGGSHVAAYVRAARAGDALRAHLAADVGLPDAPLVIGPPLDDAGGVSELLTDYDTSAAIELAQGKPVRARMACSAGDFAGAPEPLRYDRRTRILTRRPEGRFAAGRC
jgi:hypothetical protein